MFWRAEVDYKDALAAVLRRNLSEDALHQPGFAARVVKLTDGRVTADKLDVDPWQRGSVARWPYKNAWVNLIGGPMAAGALFGGMSAWASDVDDAEVTRVFDALLRGGDPIEQRAATFIDVLSDQFKGLAARGLLKAKTPLMSLTFTSIFLGLMLPNEATLWRSDVYTRPPSTSGTRSRPGSRPHRGTEPPSTCSRPSRWRSRASASSPSIS